MALIRTRRLGALLLLLAALLPVAAQQQTATGGQRVRVTLLQVNDVYQFTPVEHGTQGGLARVSTLRKQIMKDSPHTLFLLSGDTISPSVESITYEGRQMIDAWNAIGLDYSVFGNHEFDFGPDVLRARVSESKFRWLGANVIDKATGKPFADTPLFEIREFGGVKVGIFGIVLPETKTTSKPGPNVDFLDACATAKKVIPQIHAAGAGVVVALTHLSMAEDKELARCTCGQIDVIIGGHEHTLLQSSSDGVPIFKMTSDARQLARIDLNIDPQTGRVADMDWQVIAVDNTVADDPSFNAVTEKYKAKLSELAQAVGRTDVELDARSLQSRTVETNVADFIADAYRAATNADAALFNGGSIRADAVIPKGALSLRDVLSILPFGGEVVLLEVSGETLKGALENGVSRSGVGEDKEPGRFAQVSGIRYTFDPSLPSGSRVTEVTIGGQPLDPKKTYRLAVPSFIAGGGDNYAVLKGQKQLPLPAKLIDNEVLRRAIASAKSIAPKTDDRVRRLGK